MIRQSTCVLIGSLLLSSIGFAQKVTALKPTHWVSIDVPEPSDINYNAKTDSFFIVSDNGILFETDKTGKVLRKLAQKDTDFEAVYSDNQFVYAVDETNRNIYQYGIADFKLIQTINKPYSGAKNKGYESFAYKPYANQYVLITERDPITLFELDAEFAITKTVNLGEIARDISSATFYHNFLWLLSDESMQILKVNPETYEVLAKWSIPVVNPEGMTFDNQGNLYITSDDMQRLYFFNNPEKP